jgi:molybdate transport system substrate-binding protein
VRALAWLLASLWVPSAHADELHVAVAANFQAPLQKLAPAFEQATGHRLLVSAASTGKLLAQVRAGAPYDVMLSADDEAPRALAQEGLALDPPQTYAIGRLVLWSSQPGLVDGQGRWLQAPSSQKLALANPKLAPYGRAAQEALQKLDRWEAWRPQLVTGEHIAQAHQFVATGAAPAGFVAAAQVMQAGGSCWLVPEALHQPIRQDLVILKRTGQAAAARALNRSSFPGRAANCVWA